MEPAVQIARTAVDASLPLDDGRASVYVDLVISSLAPTAKQELLRMDPARFELQSDLGKRFFGIGRAAGRVATLLKQLTVKELGPVDPPTLARIQQGTIEDLETWAVRVLDATSLADLFDP